MLNVERTPIIVCAKKKKTYFCQLLLHFGNEKFEKHK